MALHHAVMDALASARILYGPTLIEREIASRQRATRRGAQRTGSAAKFAAALETASARHAAE